MRQFPFHRLLQDALYVAVFNVICALVLTYMLRTGGDFVTNLVFSMCIGGITFLLIDVARLAIWGEHHRPHWLYYLVLIVPSVGIAQWAGSRLAAWLLGLNMRVLQAGGIEAGGMILFTLLAAASASLFFTARERLIRAEAAAANERARAEAVERRAVQAQLQLLQAQLEPHMLFNTLANLQGLIALDPARAQHMLDQLIQYLRATLSASRADSTSLAEEFALIDAYLGLMAVRMGERLAYTLDLPPALGSIRIPPMLLQPLVENAIAHGLEPRVQGGHITVSACRDGAQIILSVRDDGRGLDAPAGKPGTRLGLANTRERLLALHGERASLTLQPGADGGAVVTICLPA